MHEKSNAISLGRLQISLWELMASVFVVAIVLSAGNRFGVHASIPAVGTAVLLFLTAVKKQPKSTDQNKSNEDCKKVLIAVFCVFTFCVSLAYPCIRVQLLVDSDFASISGIECLVFSGSFFVALVQNTITELRDVDHQLLSYSMMSFSFLCSPLFLVTLFQQPISNRWIHAIREFVNILVGLAATSKWLTPIVYNEVTLDYGFYFWAASVNIARFSLAHSWTNFSISYIWVLVILICV